MARHAYVVCSFIQSRESYLWSVLSAAPGNRSRLIAEYQVESAPPRRQSTADPPSSVTACIPAIQSGSTTPRCWSRSSCHPSGPRSSYDRRISTRNGPSRDSGPGFALVAEAEGITTVSRSRRRRERSRSPASRPSFCWEWGSTGTMSCTQTNFPHQLYAPRLKQGKSRSNGEHHAVTLTWTGRPLAAPADRNCGSVVDESSRWSKTHSECTRPTDWRNWDCCSCGIFHW